MAAEVWTLASHQAFVHLSSLNIGGKEQKPHRRQGLFAIPLHLLGPRGFPSRWKLTHAPTVPTPADFTHITSCSPNHMVGQTSPYSCVTDEKTGLLGSRAPQGPAVGAGEAGRESQAPEPDGLQHPPATLASRCKAFLGDWRSRAPSLHLGKGVPCHQGSGRIRGTCLTVGIPGLRPHGGTGARSTVSGSPYGRQPHRHSASSSQPKPTGKRWRQLSVCRI